MQACMVYISTHARMLGRIIRSRSTLSELHQSHTDIANARAKEAMLDYLAFVEHSASAQVDGCSVEPAKWPEWMFFDMNNSLLHPTARNIRTMLLEYFQIYKPYLLGDIVRRYPGRGASSDGDDT